MLSADALPYPAVSPLQRSFNIPDVGQANVNIDIKSPDGAAVYKLQCHSAGYSGDPDFEYSGDFECRLSSVGGQDTYSTLLTEDVNQSRDWESRGRFFAADLRGACAKIPEFGATRSFELRGIKLTMRILNPRFTNSGNLSSLRLTVTVRSDPNAQRQIAKIVPLPKGAPAVCKLQEYFVDPASFSNGD
jgi:hypothetical protein